MGLDEIWAHLQQAIGATVSPAHALTDHSNGGVFPLQGLKTSLEMLGVLGKHENVVPHETPSKHGTLRDVYLGSHPVGGMLSKLIGAAMSPHAAVSPSLVSQNPAPDPTHHWAVIVGEFYHELGGDRDLKVIYNNGKTTDQTVFGAWQKPFWIGKSTFNDEAIRQAAEEVIATMVPDYNVYNNNCQLFCMYLATMICVGGHVKPPASWELIPGFHVEPALRMSEHPEPAGRAREIMVEHTPLIPTTILAESMVGVGRQSVGPDLLIIPNTVPTAYSCKQGKVEYLEEGQIIYIALQVTTLVSITRSKHNPSAFLPCIQPCPRPPLLVPNETLLR